MGQETSAKTGALPDAGHPLLGAQMEAEAN